MIDSWLGASKQAGWNPEVGCEDDDITFPVPILGIFCSVSIESHFHCLDSLSILQVPSKENWSRLLS